MSKYVGEAVYKVSAETGDLIDARRDVRRFSRNTKDEFEKTERATEGLNTKIKRLSASISIGLAKGALTAVATAITAAAAGMVVMARESAELNRELNAQARQARLARDEFDALAFATKAYGVTGEQIADISKDITDKLGEFATAGTGAFQDFADVMGMTREEAVATAQQFQQLSGRDVMIEMVSQMEAAGASSSQMTFALESLGNEASRLLPALRNGAEGLRELEAVQKQIAEQMPINPEQRQAIDDVNVALLKLDEVFVRLRDRIIADVEPYLTFLIEGYTGVGIAISKASSAVRSFFIEIGAIDPGPTEKLNKELENLQISMRGLVRDYQMSMKAGPGGWAEEFYGKPEDIKKNLEAVKAQIAQVNKEIAEPTKRDKPDEFQIPEISGGGESGSSSNSSAFTADQIQAAKDRVQAIKESLKQEREEYEQHIKSLDMIKSGAITEDEARENERYRRELDAIEKRHKKALKLQEEFGEEVGDIEKEYNEAREAAARLHTRNLNDIQERRAQKAKEIAEKEAERKLEAAEKLAEKERKAAEREAEKAAKEAERKAEKERKAAEAEAKMLEKRMDSAMAFFESQRAAAQDHMEDMAALEDGRFTMEEIREQNRYDSLVESLSKRFEIEKEMLAGHKEELAELEMEKNEALQTIKEDHEKRMTDIHKKAEEERLEATRASLSMVASATSNMFGLIAGILKKSGDEQSSAYKVMFALSKGFAIAQAGLNLTLAISNAMKDMPYPANLGAMAQVATAGGALVSQISGATYGGGRQYGGPVGAGYQYEVNETGVPEIVTTGGKDYMTMGTQGGKVTPLDKAGMGANITVNNYGNDNVDVRQTDRGIIVDIARDEAQKARRAAVSDVAQDIRSGNGKVAKSMKTSMGVQQKAGTGR